MRIFISYSSRDRELVEAFASVLGELGHDVQFEHKVLVGQIGWYQVFSSIKKADLVIFALTPSSLHSISCNIEYTYASINDRYVLPVMLVQVAISALPPELSRDMVVEFHAESEQAVQVLAGALAHLPPPVPPPTQLRSIEVSTALATLGKQVDALSSDEAVQATLMFNIREFLERTETFDDANVLLKRLYEHEEISPTVAEEIRKTFAEIAKTRFAMNISRRRGRWLRDLSFFVAAIIVVLLAIRGVLFLQSGRSGTLIATPPLSVIPPAQSETISVVADGLTSTPTGQARGTYTAASAVTLTLIRSNIISTPATIVSTLTKVPPDTATSKPTIRPSATQDPTVTVTVTPTSTATLEVASATLRLSPTITPTKTETDSATATSSPSATQDPTVTETVTPTSTATSEVASATQRPSPTVTPTKTETELAPATDSTTPTQTPTFTASPTAITEPSTTLTLINTSTATSLFASVTYTGIVVEDTNQGLQVVQVGETASEAGVKIGDYLIDIDLESVSNRAQFMQKINTYHPLSEVALRFTRNSQVILVRLRLGTQDFTP